MLCYWFIDSDGVIRQVFEGQTGVYCPAQHYTKLEIDGDLLLILEWDACELVVVAEYNLWGSLTELAKAVEG